MAIVLKSCTVVAALLFLLGANQAQEERPRGGGGTAESPFVLLFREDLPSESSLARKLRELLPDTTWTVASPFPEASARAALERADNDPRAVVVALGAARARLAIQTCRQARLVLGGELGPDLAKVVGTAEADRIFLVPLQAPLEDLSKLRTLFLPDKVRLGFPGRDPATAPLQDIAPSVLGIHIAEGQGAVNALDEAAAHLDALILVEDEALLHELGDLLAEAKRLRLPVLTTSAWLAQSGAALAAVPDLSLAAFHLALAVKGQLRPHAKLATRAVRSVDLATLESLGISSSRVALASADVLRGPSEPRL